jgi:protein-L-isoaspartate(D-aspartate) O-methyltransferase
MTYDGRLRRGLVRALRENGSIQSERVAEAFASVPRHVFVPDMPAKAVYSDQAFPTLGKDGIPITSSSQPSIMAIMLEQLDVHPGQRVLEIGAGTGYNAALLAHLAGPRGRVTAIDINEDVAKGARRHLRAAGARVRVITGEGGLGHPSGAPYERIIATASCWQIPEAWIEQLVDGGLLVLPFRLNGVQVVIALRRDGDALVSTRAAVGGFMPMRGAFGPRRTAARLGDWLLMADYELSRRHASELEKLLGEGRDARTRYPRFRDAWNLPLHYLALQGKPLASLNRPGDPLPAFVLIVSPSSAVAVTWTRPRRSRVRVFGTGEALDFLQGTLESWAADGRPDARHLRMRVIRSSERKDALPHRHGDRYRFRRGAHAYEMWFEARAQKKEAIRPGGGSLSRPDCFSAFRG